MSGYRVMAGMGLLSRNETSGKPDDIDVPVYLSTATSSSKTDCLHQLTHRLGAGVTLDISKTRNNNYIQEMGLREFTTATSGMYEVDFTVSGIFAPKLCENWLGYAFMMGDENAMKAFTIDKSNKSNIKCYTGADFNTVYTTKDSTTVYVKLVAGSASSTVTTTAVAYNTIKDISYTYYTDKAGTKEYTGSDMSQLVYVKVSYTVGSATTPTTAITSTAVALSIAKDAKLKFYTDASATKEFTPSDADAVVYIADVTISGSTTTFNQKFGQPMLYKDVQTYLNYIEANGTQVVKLFGYTNLTGPKYFDFGYQKINSHASGVTRYDGHNEMGVLVGCIVDSASMSYESGSDAGVKFQLSCHALRDIEMITDAQFDYSSILDDIPTEVFVGGCVSVYDKDTDSYEAVAQTDSASISISNNTQKLGNCLKLNYSSYAIGALSYDVSTSTYSNDPNKYLKYFYGYADDMTPEGGETIGSQAGHYYIAKQPIAIGHMKIRTDDTSATKTSADIFLDINMTDVFVGDMSNSYSVDSAIMDEPSLRAKKTYVAVGYKS